MACSIAADPLQAAVTTLGLWNLGEDDPSAASGNVANNPTQDFSANNLDLQRVGSPVYSNVTPVPGSALSVEFSSASTSGFHMGSAISTVVDNFGVEAWVNTTSTSGVATIAYNGNPGNNGWGLYRIGSNWSALLGGVSQAVTSPVTLNTWTHLAMVRSSGTTRLYVNGTPVITTTTQIPNPANFDFGIGALGTEYFNGRIDQTRVFTFAAGAFSPSDLLYTPIPEPATPVLLTVIAAAFQFSRRKRRALG